MLVARRVLIFGHAPFLADPDGMGPPRPFERDMGGTMGGRGYGGGMDSYGSRMDMMDDRRGRYDRDMGRRDGGGRGYDALDVAEAMGRLGRGYAMEDVRDRGFNGPPMAMIGSGQGIPGGNAAPQQNCVLMFYGMNPDKMNCERLFNLICLYGNVVRIKFLKSKEGGAMVQMGDAAACDRVIQYLNNTTAFGSKFQITFSKQSYLNDQHKVGDLKDGTPVFVDFMNSKNNRFTTPEHAAKNRIQPPGSTLHYFNAPPKWEEEELTDFLVNNGCPKPDKVKIFSPKEGERSSRGLVQWNEKGVATDSICMVNHLCVRPDGKVVKPEEGQGKRSRSSNSPFIIKLCFSAAPIA